MTNNKTINTEDMNFNLSTQLLEDLSIWLFLQNKQAQDGFHLYSGISPELLPEELHKRLYSEIGATPEHFGEVIFHDAVGNIPIHDDSDFKESINSKYTVLIPIKIINQHVYTSDDLMLHSTFIHSLNNKFNFSELEVGECYEFDPTKEHGVMTNCRIMMLAFWVK